jgi:threonine synthase
MMTDSRFPGYRAPGTTFVTLSTAHPAKFDAAVKGALPTSEFPEFDFDGKVLPDVLRDLAGLEKWVTRVKGEQGVRELIEKVAKETKDGEAKPTAEEGKGSM